MAGATPPVPLDGNYHSISNALYDPVGNQFVASQAGTVLTDSDNNVNYGPTIVGLSTNNTGLPVNVPAIVQKANAVSSGGVASLAKAFGSANTAGNSIVVVCGVGNGTAATVTDSLGNTYTAAINANNSTTFAAQIFYAVNILSGANTVTVTPSASVSVAMEIYEVSGLLAQVIGQPEQSSSGTGTGTTASTSAISASVPNALAFLGVSIGTAAQNITVTSGTNWTADGGTNGLAVGGTPSGLFQFNSFSEFLATPGPVVPKATIGSSEPWAAASAVFKSVAIPVEGTVYIGGYNYTNITSTATTVVKTGSGILHAIVANTPPGSNGTLTIYDNTAGSGTKIGTITYGTVTSMPPHPLTYDVAFSTGLTIVTATGAGDYTIVWK